MTFVAVPFLYSSLFYVLKIWNIGASLVPPNFFMICILFTVYGDLHSVVEHRVGFWVVQNVEFNTEALASILYSKEKPLCVSFRINIVLHETVVLLIRDFLRKEQITWFKAGLKLQSQVVCSFLDLIKTAIFSACSIWYESSASTHYWTLLILSFVFF